jgi:hypothetical protein
MLNDLEVNLGSDLIQGSKKMWNDFDKSLGSENGE